MWRENLRRNLHRAPRVAAILILAAAAWMLVAVGISFVLSAAPPWETAGRQHEVSSWAGVTTFFVVLIPLVVREYRLNARLNK